MSKLKTLACLLIFLTLSWTASSQDSSVLIAKWRLVRLVEIALQAQACDSLQKHQEREILAGIRLQTAADSLISLTTYQLTLARADRGMCNDQLANQKALGDIQKRKKRRWMWISAGILAAWVGTEYVESRLSR